MDVVVADYRLHGRNESRNAETEAARMREASVVCRRRATDFGGSLRLLLLAKAAYLAAAPYAGWIRRPVRAARARI